jgi:hypothetical protein
LRRCGEVAGDERREGVFVGVELDRVGAEGGVGIGGDVDGGRARISGRARRARMFVMHPPPLSLSLSKGCPVPGSGGKK